MKSEKQSVNREVILQIAAAAILLGFIVFSFLTFATDNRQRIIEQNNQFIRSASRETADRISELIERSMTDAEMIAHMYDHSEEKPVITPEFLKNIEENSSFDYIEFLNPEGVDLTADGKTADLSDREYFKLGMQGQSGRCVIHNSRITSESLLIFYSPFYYKGEILGVLSCIIRGETLDGILESNYFGRQGSTYLLERNGDVLYSVGTKETPENLPEALENNGTVSGDDLAKLRDALNADNDVDFNTFNFKGSNGAGSAFVTVLKDNEWVLVQSFPSSVTREMTESANSAGIKLEVNLVAAFLVYLILIIAKNKYQKRRLVSEKQEMSGIVEATSRLFTRFALVNFETDEYRYIATKKNSAPESGIYTDLRKYLSERYIDSDGGTEKMSEVISPEFAVENLTPDVPYLQYEYEIDMDGKRWENLSLICLRREEGRPVEVLYAIQDVTALKEREAEIRLALKNSSEAAEAANRAKSDFLARMSHDIRTPMNAIMGMTAVAAMHIDDKERLTDCLSKITLSSRHLLALINDVLDMSKIESGKVSLSEEPFSIADMVDSVVTIIKSQVKSKNQEFHVHINEILHENVIGDHLRLRQVFLNILGNAVKFTAEGGKIVFSIRELKSHIHGMGCYEFICEDNGMGMDEEFLKTIFDPFTRSKDSAGIEGTGLGMPITRNIIRMMSGDIIVESKRGEGSKFTVQLHLKLQEQGDDDASALAGLRVLVADDDKDSCVTTCDILSNIGMESEWVLSGDEAIEKTVSAYERSESYSAVILDWKMPGKDGLQTAREIRDKIGGEVPIIILSAYDWTDIEAEAREAGIQAFIEKPLFRSRLVYALKTVLSSGQSEKDLVPEGLEKAEFAGKRVLLVEDNELNMEIAEELLGYTGVTVEKAENGSVAVEMVKNSPENYYDLVFMDIQMPVMNGYEAARAIRSLKREDINTLPIIAMTANAFSDDIWRSKEAGMNDHISKPVEVAKLTEALNRWLEGR